MNTQTAAQPAGAEVLYESRDHIATITLNAPERMNTISRPMLQLLSELLLRADADPAVRCVILTGSGRAFCAGLDVRAQAKGTGMLRTDTAPRTSIDLRNSPPTVLHA
nr:enoyl-CoA hydratase/isomerase family protein [Burkholderiaceae bacterium]